MKRRSQTTPGAGPSRAAGHAAGHVAPSAAGSVAPKAAGDVAEGPLRLDAATLAADLRDELADLETLTATIAAAAAGNLRARLQALGDRLRDGADAPAGVPEAAGAPCDPSPAAEVASILDALESLRLRPERGRWKDLRKIARFVARAERRLDSARVAQDTASGDRDAAKRGDA